MSPQEQSVAVEQTKTKIARGFKVVLFNDDDHTYDYVVSMLMSVCAMTKEQAFRCAVEVDMVGRTIVFFGNQEKCETISQKIKGHGADHRILKSLGSMRSEVEPA